MQSAIETVGQRHGNPWLGWHAQTVKLYQLWEVKIYTFIDENYVDVNIHKP